MQAADRRDACTARRPVVARIGDGAVVVLDGVVEPDERVVVGCRLGEVQGARDGCGLLGRCRRKLRGADPRGVALVPSGP